MTSADKYCTAKISAVQTCSRYKAANSKYCTQHNKIYNLIILSDNDQKIDFDVNNFLGWFKSEFYTSINNEICENIVINYLDQICNYLRNENIFDVTEYLGHNLSGVFMSKPDLNNLFGTTETKNVIFTVSADNLSINKIVRKKIINISNIPIERLQIECPALYAYSQIMIFLHI
jgi:hypothetical protein